MNFIKKCFVIKPSLLTFSLFLFLIFPVVFSLGVAFFSGYPSSMMIFKFIGFGIGAIPTAFFYFIFIEIPLVFIDENILGIEFLADRCINKEAFFCGTYPNFTGLFFGTFFYLILFYIITNFVSSSIKNLRAQKIIAGICIFFVLLQIVFIIVPYFYGGCEAMNSGEFFLCDFH
ncbi:MAG: hypothetical protein IPN70_01555 [Candidatus Moraniibacteriota bacterium]|nr:MAG: hypothetical protein IPN70_01555 [Candidatus Moranbacteria bacterium]